MGLSASAPWTKFYGSTPVITWLLWLLSLPA